jgi:type IV secretion system protein VirD4
MSSVYVTAMSLINTWLAPSTARSASGPSLDLDWLCEGNNSLYLVADPLDAARQAPVFGGMVTDLIGQAFTRVARTGQPIDPPLLVVLDEAGNLPLERLPQFASTVAGLGVQLVTVWQSLAQVHELYGQRADTVIANHLTKVAYGGISDKTTLDYLSMLVSEEEVETQINSDDKWRWWQGSMQLQGTRLSLAPSHTIRQMPQQHALMIHANLKPAHIHAVPWYESKTLLERTRWDPNDERGLPMSLGATPTDSDDEWPDFDSLARPAPNVGQQTPTEQPVIPTGDALGALGLRSPL